MLRILQSSILLMPLFWMLVPVVHGVTVPFTESFESDDAGWRTAGGTVGLDYFSAGGADGGSYVSDTHDFAFLADGDSIVAFRGQDEFGSSGGAYVGNWITSGAGRFSAWVRHNGPAPMNFFTRFATPINFPGATAIRFAPVLPNTWTKLSFDITPSNPEFVTLEGSSFTSIFSNIGHIQIGADVPAGFGGASLPVTLDLDRVTVETPEPNAAILLVCGLGLHIRRIRRLRL